MHPTPLTNPCMGRLVAGTLPRGPLHLGHWAGALQHWVRLQEQYECIFLIADLGRRAKFPAETQNLHQNILELLADWLAAGISPNHSLILLQSAIPAQVRLANLFSQRVSLRRVRQAIPPSGSEPDDDAPLSREMGPIYQAADILLFQADAVPARESELSLVELAQEIGRDFNRQYGPVFCEPRPLVYADPIFSGLDGRPMQQSNHNTILLGDSEEETRRKVTYLHLAAPGAEDNDQPLAEYLYSFCSDPNEATDLLDRYNSGRLGPEATRNRLADIIIERFHSLRVKRAKWLAAPDELEAILHAGAARAKSIAEETMAKVDASLKG